MFSRDLRSAEYYVGFGSFMAGGICVYAFSGDWWTIPVFYLAAIFVAFLRLLFDTAVLIWRVWRAQT